MEEDIRRETWRKTLGGRHGGRHEEGDMEEDTRRETWRKT